MCVAYETWSNIFHPKNQGGFGEKEELEVGLIQSIGLSKCTLVLKRTDLLSRFARESGLYF